ncbi:hypothetical protein [Maritalea mediterranea]|uniref:PspA/IM30 family protein n=1 Tax=Maritalea mediterranea TaxID=2909667 RepID=A0ABS9EA96_9HYPH|nr:hypothetical protein [Maritalea mediterranea]MCF4099805.1 hypothetical protein [Maritalea mediterranea]
MNVILQIVKKLLGFKKDLASITQAVSKVHSDLLEFAEEKQGEALKKTQAAMALEVEARRSTEEAEEALNLASNFAPLVPKSKVNG